MKNTELERIASILAKRDSYEIESDLLDVLWNYLVDCGIDPEEYRPNDSKTATSEPSDTFVIGQELSCRSVGDWNCVFSFKVVKRSAKFVTLLYHGIEHKVSVRNWSDGCEYCYPLGTFSMAPLLRSDSRLL
jgi:hypothetical protein